MTTTSNLTVNLVVNQTPEVVFNAINKVGTWWTKIEGNSEKVNDVFTVRFGDVYITHKIIESVPGKKVLWHCIDSSVNEWIDTNVSFDMSNQGNATAIHFTHIGMHPGLNDYNDCVKGWNKFLHEGLVKLINNGVTA